MVDLIVDCRSANTSGIGTYLRAVLTGLLASRINVVLLVGRRKRQPQWLRRLVESGNPFISLSFGAFHPLGSIECALRIPKARVFWSPHLSTPPVPLPVQKRVTSIHDVLPLDRPHYFSTFSRIGFRLWFRIAAVFSQSIITVSRFSADRIKAHLPRAYRDNVTPIWNGVTHMQLKDRRVAKPLEQEGDSGDTPYFLYVGNVKPHKGITHLLKAFADFRSSRPGFELKIVGAIGGFRSSLSAEVTRSSPPGVRFLGYVNDHQLSRLYSEASGFVFPSFYEGFGLPALEAMCAGVPVMASNRGAIPEVTGEACVRFDPANHEEFVDGFHRLLGSRDELVARGRARCSTFTWTASVSSHLRVFGFVDQTWKQS